MIRLTETENRPHIIQVAISIPDHETTCATNVPANGPEPLHTIIV